MRQSPIYDLCLAMQFIPQEFANLQVTREEFLCMKAIILLNTGKPRKAIRNLTQIGLTMQNQPNPGQTKHNQSKMKLESSHFLI